MKIKRIQHAPFTGVRTSEDEHGYNYPELTMSHVYEVFGVRFIATRIQYLIADGNGLPMWVPPPLFEVVDHAVPPQWKLAVFREDIAFQGRAIDKAESPVIACMGYQRLVEDPLHSYHLDSGESEDRRVFELVVHDAMQETKGKWVWIEDA